MTLEPTERLTKQPTETRTYSIDFVNLLSSTETITSVVSVTATPSGLTLGTGVVSGTSVAFRVSGGTDGTLYNLRVIVNTSSANVLEGDGLLEVTDIAALGVAAATHIATEDDVKLQLGIAEPTDDEASILENAILWAEGAVRQYLHYDPLQGQRTEFHPQQSFQADTGQGVWEAIGQMAVLRQVSEASTSELQLQHLPVRELAMYVWVDYDGRSGTKSTSFIEETLQQLGVGYWPNYDILDASGKGVCRDGIIRTVGLWPSNPGTVKITYTGGYTAAELRGSDPILNASPIWESIVEEACRRCRRVLLTRKSASGGLSGLPAGMLSSENLGDYSYSLDANSVRNLFASGGDVSTESKDRLEAFVNHGFALGS
jgi:hypothetical protein